MSPATLPFRARETVVPSPYPSVSALRSAHNELLKNEPEDDEATPELIAQVETFLQRGQETGALLDTPEDRWSAQTALDYWASTLYRFSQREVNPVLAKFDPALAPKLEDELCPYVGLEAFQESQHKQFFGRARLVDDMVSCLEKNRLLAVLGSSGSGKSSAVLGGLLPALKEGAIPGSEGWRYLPSIVPGSEPLKNLARALPGQADPAKLEGDPESLVRLLAESGDRPVVLVIDQFEEVFTLCENERVRQSFIASLLSLLRAPEPRHRVILTMRSDSETWVARFPDFQHHFQEGQIRVTPLSAAELREAIEKPAEHIGLKFEDGLIPTLVNDILGEPAGLPLLQFTLLKLWENRERNRVTWAAYRRLGGGRLALQRSADAFYDSLKIHQNQETARRILLRMVQPGTGVSEFTNRRIRTQRLYEIPDDPDRIKWVLEKLVAARLVRVTPGETPADDQVEIAHEALVRNWPRLVDWLDDARTEIATRRRWEARAADWAQLDGQGGLLDEVQLAEAERWITSEKAKELGYDEQLDTFVKASREAVDKVGREKRRKTRLKLWLVVAVVFGLLALAFLGREAKRSREARDLRNRAIQEATAAKEARRRAENERIRAESEALRAEEEKKRADQEARYAKKAREEAELERARALVALEQAQIERKRAEKAAALALDNAKEAENKRIEADEQKREADLAKARAESQSQYIESLWTLTKEEKERAEKALQDAEDQKKLAAEHRQELDKVLVNAGATPDDSTPGFFKGLFKGFLEKGNTLLKLRQFRLRRRPLQMGTSISLAGEGNPPGTLCCLVKDSEGVSYLLSLYPILAGTPEMYVIQPSLQDRGTAVDMVARFSRAGDNRYRSGAIARIRDGLEVDPTIPKVGKITGTATVNIGTPVRLVGRGSGITKGRVIAFDEEGNIVTNIVPAYGDLGGPLLTPDGKIVGVLWGWVEPQGPSYAAPIQKILDELDVELVVE